MSSRQTFSIRGAGDPPPTTIGPLTAHWGSRTYVMAAINLTPDSFSGDGLYREADAGGEIGEAILARVEVHARAARRDGADILDLGAESTRPGHAVVTVEEELRRLIPAIMRIRAALPEVALSVDTQKPEVAAAALTAGAHLLNDIWGTRPGNEMLQLAADRGVPIVAMHNRAAVASGAAGATFEDELIAELAAVAARGRALGIPQENLILDPGFGFGKSPAQNLVALRAIGRLRDLGHPVLLGTSRKSTLGRVLDVPPADRLYATVATSALGALAGADIIRVHDVLPNRDAVRIIDATLRARGEDAPEVLGLDPNRPDQPPRRDRRDHIAVRNVRFDAAHGVLPHEHVEAQPFFVDVELDVDLRTAGTHDDLTASVNYGEIVEEAVKAVGSAGHVELIETLAERIADAVTGVVTRSGVRVDEIRVRVRKPKAPVVAPIDWAGVEIVRRP